MPTTDPVKRRKQNCENQKRWRQRQLDSLQRLGAALDHSENRVKVLESESDELRTALRNALAEVDRLRAREGIIDQQTPLSGFNRIASIPADDVSLAGSTATTAASIGNTSSTIQLAELSLDRARTSSSSIGLSANSVSSSFSNPSRTGEEGDGNCAFIKTDEEGPTEEVPASSHLLDTTILGSESEAGYHSQPAYPLFFPPPIPLMEAPPPAPDLDLLANHPPPRLHKGVEVDPWQESFFPISSLANFDTHYGYSPDHGTIATSMTAAATMVADDADEEEVDTAPYSSDLHFTWVEDSVLGGASGIWRKMMDFPDATRLSKHISAVQNVLYGSFHKLLAKPPAVRAGVVADAFAWMIRESWPSTENCFKMMNAYAHIYNFELWRSFPCKSTYYRIHPLYRPTQLQLSVPHSPAIDWLPWPALRNKVIQEQERVDVDRLCQMALDNTLVVPGPSRNGPAAGAAVRIWDMYLLDKAEGGGTCSSSAMMYHPSSPTLWSLVQAYGLEFQDLAHFRIDRPFYAAYPEFYIPGCATRFESTTLDVRAEEHIHYPADLSSASLYRLQKRLQDWLTSTPDAT